MHSLTKLWLERWLVGLWQCVQCGWGFLFSFAGGRKKQNKFPSNLYCLIKGLNSAYQYSSICLFRMYLSSCTFFLHLLLTPLYMHHILPKGAYSQLFFHALYTFEVYNIFHKVSKGVEFFLVKSVPIRVYKFPSSYCSYALITLVCIVDPFLLQVNELHKSAATNEALLVYNFGMIECMF